MAGLTSHVRMLAFALGFGLVGVAGFAHFMTGELDWSRPDVIQGGGAEVSVLAKFRWDDRLPDQEEGHHSQDQEEGDTAQMFRGPKEVLHAFRGGQLGFQRKERPSNSVESRMREITQFLGSRGANLRSELKTCHAHNIDGRDGVVRADHQPHTHADVF